MNKSKMFIFAMALIVLSAHTTHAQVPTPVDELEVAASCHDSNSETWEPFTLKADLMQLNESGNVEAWIVIDGRNPEQRPSFTIYKHSANVFRFKGSVITVPFTAGPTTPLNNVFDGWSNGLKAHLGVQVSPASGLPFAPAPLLSTAIVECNLNPKLLEPN